MSKYKGLLIGLAVWAIITLMGGCSRGTMAPSTIVTTPLAWTSTITDSVSGNRCVVAALPQAKRDPNTGRATLVLDGMAATLTVSDHCPTCTQSHTFVWVGASGQVLDLTTTFPDPHTSGCDTPYGLIEYLIKAELHLTRTANGWAGTQTNHYILLNDVTHAPTGDTVIDTLAVSLDNSL